ncbi:MAG: ABC transporter permease [Planctomycetaceae bacterium]|nr:ABC transporter permease [Planctomycetaceae bacterium]
MNNSATVLEGSPAGGDTVAWRAMVMFVGPLLGLLGVYGLFLLIDVGGKMGTSNQIENIIIQSVIVATASIGMTMVIIAGGIDLSVGSTIALSSVLVSYLIRNGAWLSWALAKVGISDAPAVRAAALWLAPIIGIGGGAVCGWVIGLLVTRLKVAPFIVTLGAMLIFRGLAKGIADSKPIYPDLQWLGQLLSLSSPTERWSPQASIVLWTCWAIVALTVLAGGVLTVVRFWRMSADWPVRTAPMRMMWTVLSAGAVWTVWFWKVLWPGVDLGRTFYDSEILWRLVLALIGGGLGACASWVAWRAAGRYPVNSGGLRQVLLVLIPLVWYLAAAFLGWFTWGWAAGAWLMLVMALMAGGVLRYTRFGRHVFAVGSNEATARLCGVNVTRVKIKVYMVVGAAAGLAGLMMLSYTTVGDPTAGAGYELDVIAAVVIGGGSLSGGEGSILGTLVGALIVKVISVGADQCGWPKYIKEIVTGAIIVVAVALDRLRHRRTAG